MSLTQTLPTYLYFVPSVIAVIVIAYTLVTRKPLQKSEVFFVGYETHDFGIRTAGADEQYIQHRRGIYNDNQQSMCSIVSVDAAGGYLYTPLVAGDVVYVVTTGNAYRIRHHGSKPHKFRAARFDLNVRQSTSPDTPFQIQHSGKWRDLRVPSGADNELIKLSQSIQFGGNAAIEADRKSIGKKAPESRSWSVK